MKFEIMPTSRVLAQWVKNLLEFFKDIPVCGIFGFDYAFESTLPN